MPRDVDVRLPPDRIDDPLALREAAALAAGVAPNRLSHTTVLRRSVDARSRRPVYALRVRVWIDETPAEPAPWSPALRDVRGARPVVVVGAGPAGLFTALRLVESGLRPIVLERGKDVRRRRRDVARLHRSGVVDPESNYCFGEGGAGTFSDGKLYTRSTKRGDVQRVLRTLVHFGASSDILIDAHPHIGTNRLPAIIERMHAAIVAHGGEVHFDTRVDDLVLRDGHVRGVVANGATIEGDAVLLATGHSARDVYALLDRLGLGLEAKPFAMGVRVEHPQALIDRIQYHADARPVGLPAASYALVTRAGDRGVYSFCMCPGGVVCPAMTAPGEIVVNGWSPSRRSAPRASSGIVVETTLADIHAVGADALAGVRLQASVEQTAQAATGRAGVAPAQRLGDFVAGRASSDLPACSYGPGVAAVNLGDVLPTWTARALRAAFQSFGRSMRGYLTNDAIVIGVESRTSSPVRIPRDRATGMHPDAPGLFPCGEGAGAAGGIMSAAMDGLRSAEAMLAFLGASTPPSAG